MKAAGVVVEGLEIATRFRNFSSCAVFIEETSLRL